MVRCSDWGQCKERQPNNSSEARVEAKLDQQGEDELSEQGEDEIRLDGVYEGE